MLVLLTLLFILLQPGLIITATGLPSGKYIASSQTSTLDVLIHSVVFFTINKLIITNTIGLGFLKDIETQILGS
jgi:hypothetical protein